MALAVLVTTMYACELLYSPTTPNWDSDTVVLGYFPAFKLLRGNFKRSICANGNFCVYNLHKLLFQRSVGVVEKNNKRANGAFVASIDLFQLANKICRLVSWSRCPSTNLYYYGYHGLTHIGLVSCFFAPSSGGVP